MYVADYQGSPVPSVTQPVIDLFYFSNISSSCNLHSLHTRTRKKMDDSLPALKILMIGPSGAGKSARTSVLVTAQFATY